MQLQKRKYSRVFLERMRNGCHQSDKHWKCFNAALWKRLTNSAEHLWTFLSVQIYTIFNSTEQGQDGYRS